MSVRSPFVSLIPFVIIDRSAANASPNIGAAASALFACARARVQGTRAETVPPPLPSRGTCGDG